MEDSNQNNKYALVTGAAKGIGKSIALKFAENGISVAINYKSSKDSAVILSETIKSMGVESFAVQADVASLIQVTEMMKKVIDTWGKIIKTTNPFLISFPLRNYH